MIISACLLALSCSKAMPDEAVVVPAGEKVTFTIPETKVTIGADEGNGTRKYAFEEGDVVYAVTTGGSVAAMEFKGENTFAGEFSKPVGTDEKISLYYNCYSAENNAPAYVQNGKPWLVSSDNGYYPVSDIGCSEGRHRTSGHLKKVRVHNRLPREE